MAKKKTEEQRPKTGTRVVATLDADGSFKIEVRSFVLNAEGGNTSRAEDMTDALPADLRKQLKKEMEIIRDLTCEDVEKLAQIDANQFDIFKAGKTPPNVRQKNFKEKLAGAADELKVEKKGK